MTRFQVAFARTRAENPNFTARQIGAPALAELPAAQTAARLGFDELTPYTDAYGGVYIGGRFQNVPTAVWGSARRTR
jgi:hypothetical protein